MIIAAHHQSDPWRPRNAWPAEAYVQWGRGGIVISPSGNYGTAFFEAFPRNETNASSFIRGEGATLEEAEDKAFAQFQRDQACSHVIGRRGYLNGAGKCVHCDAFISRAFTPVAELGAWRKPLSTTQLEIIKDGYLLTDPDSSEDRNKRWRRIWLKARIAGINVPPVPDLSGTTGSDRKKLSEQFREACRTAVVDYLLANIDRLDEIFPETTDTSLGDFFSSMGRRNLLRALLHHPDLTPEQKSQIEVRL